MKEKTVNASWAIAFSVASVWFGTHVGGGFATGNQVVNFFAQYGKTAVILPFFAMGLLAVVMYIVVRFAQLNGFDNYRDTWRALYPRPWMEIFFEIFYIIILLAAVASAIAGAGEVAANLLGITYVGVSRLLCNLVIIAILIFLSIFGSKLIMAASSVLSVAILIITAVVVITALSADLDAISELMLKSRGLSCAEYTDAPLTALIRGIFAYAGFQCVSLPAVIAVSSGFGKTMAKKSMLLGFIMNAGALAAAGYMLYRWYPLLKSLQDAQIEGYLNALGIPNQTLLSIIGIKWIMAIYSILLLCAFISTSITLVFSMIQRMQGKCFPEKIKNEKIRGVIVGAVTIGICFAISLLGLTRIVTYAYGYDGYYAILVIIIPALVWGLPKVIKLEKEKKNELNTEVAEK